jgi:hypothetical protein
MTAQDIIAALKGAKPLYAAVSAVLTLLLGKSHISPFEDDMPVPLKTVLICLSIAVIFTLEPAQNVLGVPRLLGWLGFSVVVSLALYLLVYQMFGYDKILAEQKKGWFRTFLKYRQVKILGGLWRTAAAKEAAARNRTAQDFLADSAFNQDQVWSRTSRAPVQLLAILSYVVLVISLIAIIAVSLGV